MANITISKIQLKQQFVIPEINRLPKNILNIFPAKLKKILEELPHQNLKELEEIRVRLKRPLTIFTGKNDYAITEAGKLTSKFDDGKFIEKEDMEKILHIMSQSSIYAWEEEFKRGYITLQGGHRIGITGKAVLDKGVVKTLKDISGLNIRVAREIIGIADKILPFILDQNKRVRHTLLVSPPQCGKTTLLRDIIRLLSNGDFRNKFPGVNVGLVDERSELAGCFEGIPQYSIGFRTDVLDGCPKAQGMIMLIRSMSPQVIATDEIGTLEDINAMGEVLNAGISLITTVHGRDIQELQNRPILRGILEQKLFSRIIILGRSHGVGTIEKIIDGYTFEPILSEPFRGRGG